MNKKQNLFIIIVLLLVISAGTFYYLKKNNIWPKSVNKLSQEEKNSLYEKYLTEGLKYKSEGDAGDKKAYVQALEAYLKAIEISQNKYWLPQVNLGNTYRSLGDLTAAEKAYTQAIEISNYSESSIYSAKIDLYRYDLKRPNDEIKNLYIDAIGHVVENANLVASYASFLKDIGEYAEAIKYFELLSKKFPEQKSYLLEINELRLKLK